MDPIKRTHPLCTTPKPYFTADFNNYFLLLHETVSGSLQGILENEAVFLYVESGRGVIAINGEDFPLYPGCACFLQTCHVYSLFAHEPEPLRLAVIVMDDSLQSYSSFRRPISGENEERFDEIPHVILSSQKQAEMQELLNRCRQEDCSSDGQGPLIKAALYCQIRLFLRREAASQESKGSSLTIGWNAWAYLTKCSGTHIRPSDIADAFHISVSHLNRELRRISNYDCRSLLARSRVLNATSMLLFNDLSMQYISSCVGFSSEHSFYRSFKAWQGMTPQEYRKRILSPHNRCPRQRIYEKPYAILHYISSNYRNDITLKTASHALFLSERAINQITLDFFQYPFYRLVTNWRMRHGEALLICTSLPVCDIAIDVGFHSVHTFSRLFQERRHMTPGQFRKERRLTDETI